MGNADPRDFGYPGALREAETNLLKKRHPEYTSDEAEPWVGFGLSGGGIRSATFCLGVFQELARRHLLEKVDYISSVSGGGYFASFLGRLFAREDVNGIEDVRRILSPEAGEEGEAPESSEETGEPPPTYRNRLSGDWKSRVFGWLRDNSRYLSPRGAGDLLLDLAVVFRNWAAVQVVLLSFLLSVFFLAQLFRLVMDAGIDARGLLVCWAPFGQHLWWSPYLLVAAFVFVLGVAPLGWSYWMVESPDPRQAGRFWRNFVWVEGGGQQVAPFIGALTAIALAILGAAITWRHHHTASWVCILLAVVGIETLLLWRWILMRALANADQAYAERGPEADPDRWLFAKNDARNRVSKGLKWALLIALAVLAFALIDSLGQTIYLLSTLHDARLKLWAMGIFGPLIAAAPFAKWVASNLGRTNDDKRPSVPWKLVATIGAILLAAAVFIGVDIVSHGVAWEFKEPTGAPRALLCPPQTSLMAAALPPKLRVCDECYHPPVVGRRDGWAAMRLAVAFAIAGLFSFFFGRTWTFLNRSSLRATYAARLTRAYLGASNVLRLLTPDERATEAARPSGNEPGASDTVHTLGRDGTVTEVMPGDDITQDRYWQLSDVSRYERGAPIHLVNVTVNETLEARSQVQQQDRKGIGMALGPAGISLGVRHHVVFNKESDAARDGQYQDVKVFPEDQSFVVFDYGGQEGQGERRVFTGERLSLGTWTAISGAAFSTGLGWRTSLAMSLLAGFFNVRLGYWWNSGLNPAARGRVKTPVDARRHAGQKISAKRVSQKSGFAFTRLFPVQAYLFDEFLSRFHGTARQWWYLTDGGHFENLGGYELIRRRVPNIVLIDAEADPEYTFEGLANLVRKARLDFGAEIRFLNVAELDRLFAGSNVRRYFGTLDQLRRGTWIEEPVGDPADPKVHRKTIQPVDIEKLSLAHAAIADVFYYDRPGQAGSRLLYIKPTLIGEEPADVHRYHCEHPTFPQETTAEQWFNEAQWESYRKLGEHIAGRILAGASKAPASGSFWPY